MVPGGEDDAFNGVLLVDKPIGPTSHDIVHRVRRFFNIRKVGHGGTLDPMASGLMVLLLGKTTRLSDRFMGADKVYEGTFRLGIATDSQDAMGEVIQTGDASVVTEVQLQEQMRRLLGDSLQMPPMTSAVKVNGVPLYKHARKGREIERKARLIHVFRFDLKSYQPPDVDFEVKSTKGTYVRTLCADIGEALGCGAHLTRLRRTTCGSFMIAEALPVPDILKLSPSELAARVIPARTFQ